MVDKVDNGEIAYNLAKKLSSYAEAGRVMGVYRATVWDRAEAYRLRNNLPPAIDVKVKGIKHDKEAYDVVARYGHFQEASDQTGIPVRTLRDRVARHCEKEGIDSPSVESREPADVIGKSDVYEGNHDVRYPSIQIHYKEVETKLFPKAGKAKRYLFTCAQNNTPIYDDAWENLIALKEHYDAELHVSRFTYNKTGFEGSRKPGSGKASDRDEVWYDKRIDPYLSDDQIRIAPGLIWCGELNILPTAVRPLSGMGTYTRNESGIFPHVKVSMDSYPRVVENDEPRFCYTTGTVTQRNYIQKKAGQKAEFHHVYGALLVEVDDNGYWWARQINADANGHMCDLNIHVYGGEVHERHQVESIVWGDVHVATIDDECEMAGWLNDDSMTNVLLPKYQFMHDVLDFRARNHHDKGNHHRGFQLFLRGNDEVESEIYQTCEWIRDRQKEAREFDGEVVIVASNHNDFFKRWLREGDYRQDHKNAIFFLEAQLAYYRSMQNNRPVHPFLWAYSKWFEDTEVTFLEDDQSFIVADIEHSMHGHLGVNGSRGTRQNFVNIGDKINIGHSHSAGIMDGIYQAGVVGDHNKMDYARGPTSWSHSNIITYTNGKRAIITIRDGRWRA